MKIGAHVSASGSIDQAIDRGLELGCEAIQIFASNPRQWKAATHSTASRDAFREKREGSGIEVVVAHASYLINLASPDRSARARGIRSLVSDLKVIEAIRGDGVVTHIGSRLGRPEGEAIGRVVRSVETVLERTEGVRLYLENSAGPTIGGTFEELAALLDGIGGHPRVGICLDTAHLYGAGVDIRKASGVKTMLRRFDEIVGLDRLGLFHLNDSKAGLGSRRDRHENIGAGHIGEEGFRVLLRDRRLKGIAGVLEVPGFEGGGPDARNMEILRRLRGRGTKPRVRRP